MENLYEKLQIKALCHIFQCISLTASQKLYSMSQKFINLVEKTSKKVANFNEQKPKRFARKKSDSSDKSIDSKRSKGSDFQPHYIKNSPPQSASKNQKVYLDSSSIFQHLANQTLLIKESTSTRGKYSRTRTDRMRAETKQQSQLKLNELKTELQLRSKQIQILANECKYLKQSLAQQGSKRKKVQNQNKEILEQLKQKKKQVQKWEIQNKKLMKQKQYLEKQIQFLERINYDQKTRSSQSYREKYLQKEVNRLKDSIKKGQNENEKLLQDQIAILKDQNYIVHSHHRALKMAHQTLQKQFQKQRHQQKQSILQSQEYIKLRQKYKRFLEQYKRLRIQYCELQAELNLSRSQILNKDEYEELSINLSQSSSQKSMPIFKGGNNVQLKIINSKQNSPSYKGNNLKKVDLVSYACPGSLIIKDKNVGNINQVSINMTGNIKNNLSSNQKRKFQS